MVGNMSVNNTATLVVLYNSVHLLSLSSYSVLISEREFHNYNSKFTGLLLK